MHVVTCPWKVLFATVPPVDYCDGWLCFTCSLGMKDEITAITFVALGTSLPDTFASKTAATMDPYADASIGNITGSNSVNVFLGLGIPWTMAAVYWMAMGATDEWKRHFDDGEKYEGVK